MEDTIAFHIPYIVLTALFTLTIISTEARKCLIYVKIALTTRCKRTTTHHNSRDFLISKLYIFFGLSYLFITTIHIFMLAANKTLIDETPLSKQDPYSYILFVVSFAWAFLLLTYKEN